MPAWADLGEPHQVWNRPGGGFTALSLGRLHSDREGCSWFGTRNVGLVMIWPRSYHVVAAPLRITDDKGKVVAREGDWIRTSGGNIAPSYRARCETAQIRGRWLPTRIEFWGKIKPPLR